MSKAIWVKGKKVQANPNPVKLTCPRCSYTWLYRGFNRFYATCPNCLRKVKVAGS